MEMDDTDFAHRQETEILKTQIRQIREELARRTTEPTVLITDFPAGSLGARFGSIGQRFNQKKVATSRDDVAKPKE
jgi:hypothetical protein